MLKCPKVQEDCDMPYEENMLLGNLCPGKTGNTIGLNSMLMKQQYIINKMFLNRNTY